MTFPVVGSNIPSSYQISNSLRFNQGDSAYLSRTPSTTGNRKIMTFSWWMKLGTPMVTGGTDIIFSAGASGSNPTFNIGFNDGNSVGGSVPFRLSILDVTASVNIGLSSDMLFRDYNAWYHCVVVIDTSQATSGNRVKLYVNGTQQTLGANTTYSSNVQPSLNYDVNYNTNSHPSFIGKLSYGTGNFDGYLAEAHFIDGQALSPTDFGEFDEDSGVWKPKQYTGTFGNNGYYLKFNNTGNMGEDSSGNDNTFTPTNLSGTTDVTTDTPTNNFATFNGVDFNGGALEQGNLKQNNSGACNTNGTIGMPTGNGIGKFTLIVLLVVVL